MKNERLIVESALVVTRRSRRNVQALQQVVHPLRFFFHFIDKECKFRDNPRLVPDSVSERFPDFLLVCIQLFKDGLLVLGEHHADVNLCQAEIRAYTHVYNGNERVAQQSALVALKDVAELFLYEPAEFLLSNGSHSGVKIRRCGGVSSCLL